MGKFLTDFLTDVDTNVSKLTSEAHFDCSS